MLLAIIHDAFKNLSANLLRSGLTMLGVIIGVASVIAMIAIVEGGQVWLVSSIERLGTNLLFVWKKRLTVEERRMFAGRNIKLKYDDALATRQHFPELTVAPVDSFDGQVKAGDRDFNGRITGTSPEYSEMRNFFPARGRFITTVDLQEWRRSVVLGKTVAEVLFGTESPIGKEVKIFGGVKKGKKVDVTKGEKKEQQTVEEYRFVVIGVMEPKGEIHGRDWDEKVFIPATTLIRFFKGKNRIGHMVIYVPDRNRMDEFTQKLHQFLVQRHDGVDDIRIRNQGDFLGVVEQTLWTFRIVLGGIALVALLVGGIGIMNIMLVTVTERTREIGLRKAIGASRKDILLQFLIESTAISIIGGGVGIIFGIFAAYGFGNLVAQAMPGGGDWGAVVEPTAILIAFTFAVGVGIVFGLFPAMKASNLDPAEALRYQ
jgi:putative ABC transport system permease protein